MFVSNERGANGRSGGTIGAADAHGARRERQRHRLAARTRRLRCRRVNAAITTLGTVQGQVGQLQNRLSYAISLAQSQIVNTKAAESRIRDANIAEESANLTRYNILNQSGIAALAQANQSTSAVLSLLR